MTTSYIPVTVNLDPANAPVGMNGTDFYTSGLAIQNQANAIMAGGGSPSSAQSFVSNALQNLTSMGANSAYFTPAAGDTSQPTAPTWYNKLLDSVVPRVDPSTLNTIDPSTGKSAPYSAGPFAGWNLSRAITIIIGLLLLLGALIMFSTSKENVVNLVQSVAKNPELLAE